MSTATKQSGPTLIARPNTPAWHSARRRCISASWAAAACGLSRYKTRLECYLWLKGLLDEAPESDAMRMGLRLEKVIQDEYTAKTGRHVAAAGSLYVHSDTPWIGASPDAFATGDDGDLWLLECKSLTWRLASELGDEGSDEVPIDWLLQVQQQMYVLDCRRADIAVLVDNRLRIFGVDRDDELIAEMLQQERDLWERVQHDEPPAPDWEHPRTSALIQAAFKNKTGLTIDLPDLLVVQWERQKQLGQQIKALQAERETLRSQVAWAIGDHLAARIPGSELEIYKMHVPAADYQAHRKEHYQLRERKAPPQ